MRTKSSLFQTLFVAPVASIALGAARPNDPILAMTNLKQYQVGVQGSHGWPMGVNPFGRYNMQRFSSDTFRSSPVALVHVLAAAGLP